MKKKFSQEYAPVPTPESVVLNAFEDDIIKLKREKQEYGAFVILVDVVSKGLYRDVRDLDMPPETRTRLLSWCRQLEATFYPSKP